ncbi:MAG: hypothetical protein EAZ92_14580 [Candidatus Kapaibacterium sp.]|nr:MAG: hypothetical protein EAZ92_14580 [Candidatus Kapabacteria bacterium]
MFVQFFERTAMQSFFFVPFFLVAMNMGASSCASSAVTATIVEKIAEGRRTALVNHLGKSFPRTDSVYAVYDAQNIPTTKYEFFGEIFLSLARPAAEPEVIEGVMVLEAKERGANAVLLQDISFSGSMWQVHTRGRLIRYK